MEDIQEELNKKITEANEKRFKQTPADSTDRGRKEGTTQEKALDRKKIETVKIPDRPFTLPEALLIQTWVLKEAINIWMNLTPHQRLLKAKDISEMVNKYGKRTEAIEYLKEAIKDIESRRAKDLEERREIVSRSGGSDRASKELLENAGFKRVSDA